MKKPRKLQWLKRYPWPKDEILQEAGEVDLLIEKAKYELAEEIQGKYPAIKREQ